MDDNKETTATASTVAEESAIATTATTPADGNSGDGNDDSAQFRKCWGLYNFRGSSKGEGFAYMAFGHGSIYMSNVFLSTAFIYLASQEAGCIDEETDRVIPNCPTRVYGFYPSSLVTNIATIAGLLTAFILPVFGAVIDFTSKRRTIGMVIGSLIGIIQGTQIGIGPRTWFFMAVLQAIVAALFEIHYLLTLSYLPDVVRYDVGPDVMNVFTRYFLQIQFGGELVYVLIITLVSIFLKLNSIVTGQLGQLVATIWLVYSFIRGWALLPPMEGRHEAPTDKSVIRAGFAQNFNTCRQIYRHSKTLWVFFTTVALAEGGTAALLPIAVTFLTRVLKFNAIQIGFAFFVALIAAMPGTAFSAYFSRKYNPDIGLRIMLVSGAIVTAGGSFALSEDRAYLGYVWAVFWGITNGWYWASEQLLFSVVMPEGQEAELTGFFVYCTIILSWVCPMFYSVMVEKGVPENWGLMPIVFFKLIAVANLCRMPKWNEVVESTHKKLHLYEDDGINEETGEEIRQEVKETEAGSDKTEDAV